jgi:YVTN family beta-propeller protein
MKFLCDAERCIDCNACVTACKNEHEVPWGVNRRRVVTINDGERGQRSISVACMHCSDAPCRAVCPVDCFYDTDEGVVLHSKDLCIGCGYCFYACPFGAPQFPQASNFGSRGKMDKCTFCSGGPEADNSAEEFRKYAATARPRASFRFVLRCAPPKRCWLVTATSYPPSIASRWSPAVSVLARGAGAPHTTRRSAAEYIEGMGISPDGTVLVNTSETTNMAHFIDTKTHEIVANVLVDTRPRFAEFRADGKQLWISSEVGGTVSVIDPAKHEIIKKIGFEIPGVQKEAVQPVGIRITKDDKTAFVALGPANRVAIVDVETLEVTNYLLVGQRVWQLAFTPDEKYLISTNGNSNDVSFIDVAERQVIKSVEVGQLPWGVVVAPQ